MRYENEICQGCGKIMSEGEDIVFCPECGTPQHRECYERENRCVNAHLHADDFEWLPKHAEQSAESDVQTRSKGCKICRFCGHENDGENEVCENCSAPLDIFPMNGFGFSQYEDKNGGDYSYRPPFDVKLDEDKQDAPGSQGEVSGGEQQGSGTWQTDGTIPNDWQDMHENQGGAFGMPPIVDTPEREMEIYLRKNTEKYLKKFDKIEKKGVTFNFAAFFFGGYWAFYRKMYKLGAVVLAISLALSMVVYVPFTSFLDKLDTIEQQMQEKDLSDLTEAEIVQLYDEMYEAALESMPTLLIYIGASAAVNITLGFIADRIYRKKAKADIEQAKAQANSPGEKIFYLTRKGGTSAFMPVLAYMVLYLVSSVLTKIFF